MNDPVQTGDVFANRHGDLLEVTDSLRRTYRVVLRQPQSSLSSGIVRSTLNYGGRVRGEFNAALLAPRELCTYLGHRDHIALLEGVTT